MTIRGQLCPIDSFLAHLEDQQHDENRCHGEPNQHRSDAQERSPAQHQTAALTSETEPLISRIEADGQFDHEEGENDLQRPMPPNLADWLWEEEFGPHVRQRRARLGAGSAWQDGISCLRLASAPRLTTET